MPLWLLSNWRLILGGLALLALVGYVGYSELRIARLEKVNAILTADVQTVSQDLENAKAGVSAIDNALRQYQTWVQESISTVKRTQRRIVEENSRLQAILDNLVVPAMAATRIEDAPRIEFFLESIGPDNGALRIMRVRPPG